MTTSHTFFYWTPRVLSILFIGFISLFSLDVFSEYSGIESLIAFSVHLLPVAGLCVALAIAWKYDWFGAVAYIGFAMWYVYSAGLDRPWSWYAAIALPALIVGVLFLISWRQRRTSTTSENNVQ